VLIWHNQLKALEALLFQFYKHFIVKGGGSLVKKTQTSSILSAIIINETSYKLGILS
jgi:hypothetical protein